jgi:hypothetical protein
MASAKKESRDRSDQWEKDKTLQAQFFAAAAPASKQEEHSSEEEYQDDKEKKAFMKSFMASWISSQKDKRRRINANVVIMIPVTLSKTIQHLLNL